MPFSQMALLRRDSSIIQITQLLLLPLPAIRALGKNTSWGTSIASRNVLFLPR
jgi:hypothetical protein